MISKTRVFYLTILIISMTVFVSMVLAGCSNTKGKTGVAVSTEAEVSNIRQSIQADAKDISKAGTQVTPRETGEYITRKGDKVYKTAGQLKTIERLGRENDALRTQIDALQTEASKAEAKWFSDLRKNCIYALIVILGIGILLQKKIIFYTAVFPILGYVATYVLPTIAFIMPYVSWAGIIFALVWTIYRYRNVIVPQLVDTVQVVKGYLTEQDHKESFGYVDSHANRIQSKETKQEVRRIKRDMQKKTPEGEYTGDYDGEYA